MKRYIQTILLSCLLAFTGCGDWIEVEPENSVTFSNYFKTEKDAQSLLYNLHWNLRRLPYPVSGWTELAEEQNGTYTGDYLPLLLRSWSLEYKIIDAAHLIIDNASRFPLPEEVIKPYVLQAYFAKAQAYFDVAINWGEAPIIKEGVSYKKYAKSSVSEVLDEAEKFALLAMELPVYEQLKIEGVTMCKQYGSKGAAAALLAKLYAWRAGVEGKEECWKKAEEYCTKIIENQVGFYKLENTPDSVCKITLKGNGTESIWEMYQDPKENGAVFYGTALGSNTNLVGFPVISTARPMDYAQYVVTKKTVKELYDKEDLRRSAYFWGTDADSIFLKSVDGKLIADTVRENGVVKEKFDNRKIERAFLYKFRYPYYVFFDWDTNPRWQGMDMNVVRCRLADIILLRAECRARQGNPAAVDDLNEIRRRAHKQDRRYDFPSADDVKNGLAGDIQLAIYREREKELFLEGHRYHDARRNGLDYVRRLLPAFAKLTDQDIQDGALYLGIIKDAFLNNDLMRQNVYWNRRQQ